MILRVFRKSKYIHAMDLTKDVFDIEAHRSLIARSINNVCTELCQNTIKNEFFYDLVDSRYQVNLESLQIELSAQVTIVDQDFLLSLAALFNDIENTSDVEEIGNMVHNFKGLLAELSGNYHVYDV